MRTHRLVREQRIARPLDQVFEFFAQPRNLERITPPFLRFSLVSGEQRPIAQGTRLAYRLSLHGVPLRWVSEIAVWEPGVGFVDRQLHGPYRLWHHQHTFRADGAGTIVGDQVTYALPLRPLGELAHRLVRRDLTQIFDYRRAAVASLLA